MQYRKDKFGEDLSLLGFGCMRFTKKGNAIDIDKAEKEIMAAYHAGVYVFHDYRAELCQHGRQAQQPGKPQLLTAQQGSPSAQLLQ